MKRLATPLRLTWDWDWPPIVRRGQRSRRPPAERVASVGAEIVRARVLLLEVGYPDPGALQSGELAAALAGFTGSLSFVLTPDAASSLAGKEPRSALGADEVWLDATPEGGALPDGMASWPSLRFHVTAANAGEVAERIERAAAGGATAFSLPNLPLFGEILRHADTANPRAAQIAELARRIAAVVERRPGIDLRIHHYGLWQALRSSGAHPQGEDAQGSGCQAGSGLAYVDPQGVLHPCASLPVPIARVGAGTIAEAWSSGELAVLREGIARLPQACSGCPGESTCRGGCRGWAHYLAGSWDAPGPDCFRT